MQIHSRKEKNTFVISLHGRIIQDADTTEFKDVVREAVINGQKKVAVDMSGVDWISSTGIAALIHAYTMMKEVDGEFRLAQIGEAVLNVLKINKLNLVFDIHPTVDDAVNAMA